MAPAQPQGRTGPLAGYSALYGGSFDPPHVGHQMACLYLLETLGADDVWLVPTAQHAFGKTLRPYAHRRAMVQRLVAPFGARAVVSDVEAERAGKSTTAATLAMLNERYPARRWAVVVGADLLPALHRWDDAETLFASVGLVVLNRAGADVDVPQQSFPARPWLAEGGPALPEVSSTVLRARLAAGEDVTGWVPLEVLAYARAHKLYAP